MSDERAKPLVWIEEINIGKRALRTKADLKRITGSILAGTKIAHARVFVCQWAIKAESAAVNRASDTAFEARGGSGRKK